MTEDRDPLLARLFAAAHQDFDHEQFAAAVRARIERLRRRTLLKLAGALAVLLAGTALVADPVIRSVELLAQVMPTSLFAIDDRLVAELLAPVNSVGALVAFGTLAVILACRRLFGR